MGEGARSVAAAMGEGAPGKGGGAPGMGEGAPGMGVEGASHGHMDRRLAMAEPIMEFRLAAVTLLLNNNIK